MFAYAVESARSFVNHYSNQYIYFLPLHPADKALNFTSPIDNYTFVFLTHSWQDSIQ